MTVIQKHIQSFEQLPEPKIKYGLGIFSKQHPGWPEQVSSKKCYTVDAVEGVSVYTKETAPEELCSLIGSIAGSHNKFDAFHYAHLDDVVIIHIAQGVSLTTPLVLKSLLSESCHVQHVLVVAEPGSSVTFLDLHQSSSDTIFHSHVVELLVKEKAHVSFTTIQDLEPSTFQTARKHAQVLKDAALGWHESHLGSNHSRVRTQTSLEGSGAFCRLNSLFFGLSNQLLDMKSVVHHNASSTKSLMLNRGILADLAKTIHRGSIIIGKGNKSCDGYQKQETLLLSDAAHIDAVPMLEIANQEVKCAHGATISHINEDSLFYLMSRGLSKKDAYRVVVQGFFAPVLDSLDEQTRVLLSQRLSLRVDSLDFSTIVGGANE